MASEIQDLIARERLPADFEPTTLAHYRAIAEWIAARRRMRGAPILVGCSGPQGSGKSTLALFLEALLRPMGPFAVARLSIDDLYLTRREREALGAAVHPLLVTRGVPGTHDIDLGVALIDRLMTAAPGDVTPIPQFDKATDTRAPEAAWPRFEGRADIVLLEGWCVGATPTPDGELADPINDLERFSDPDLVWRRYVNAQLEGPYRRLFGRIDALVAVQADDFDCVLGWRTEQEHKLAARLKADPRAGDARVMSDEAIRTFIMHYERITRALLKTMPDQADVVVDLDPDRTIRAVRMRTS